MESFDNFNWLKSINDIKEGRNPYDNSQEGELNDLGNLDYYNYVIKSDILTISWYNYNVVERIYITYIREFGEDFIREEAKKLRSKTAKAWILYALDKYQDIVVHRNKKFESDLQALLDRLRIKTPNLIDLFRNYMPFITNIDIYKFAYDNIDSPNFEYFYILLILWYESEYPTYFPNVYTQKNNFIQEIYNFQNEITLNIISNAPVEIRGKILVKLHESFKQINQTNIFEDKLNLSYDKILYNKENPLTGDFYIPWSKVEFYNKFYLISHPNVPSNITQPYKIDDKHSRIAFDDIKKLFSKRLPPIHVEAKNGKIVKVLNEAYLSECTILMEHEVNAKIEKKDSIDKEKVEKKILTKDEAKSMILSKDFKSQYLDNLCTQQIENYKVICCIEHRINANGSIHDEYSFIFTIKESKKKLYLAYENANNSRCTYILPVRNGTWEESIDNIYNFFASNEVNKRQQMAAGKIDLKLAGNYDYKRVYHNDYSSWYYTIQAFLRGF